MNRDELSKMLDLVDEKYLNEILGDESASVVKVTTVKHRSMGSGLACIAAALALVIGLTLLTNTKPSEITVDEGQGAVTDSETVTDIIETDEPDNEPYDYGELFSSPIDLGRGVFSDYADEEVYFYAENADGLLPDRLSALMNGSFDTMATVTFDDSGKASSANISLISSNNHLYQLNIAMSKNGGLWDGFNYAGKTARLGKTVHSCYCEKTEGLYLWAYFENEETAFALYSLGFEKDEAASILDGLITGSISLDSFTPDNADGMWQNMTLEQAAALPEFKGKICTETNLGGKYLSGEKVVLTKNINKGEDCELSFSVGYCDSSNGSNVSVSYCIGNDKAPASANPVTAIEAVTPEKIDEWVSSGEYNLCINADGVYVTVIGANPEFLTALTEHLKAAGS